MTETKLKTGSLRLREVRDADLDAFFEQQLDDQFRHVLAFGPLDPKDRLAFDKKWTHQRNSESITFWTAEFTPTGATSAQVTGYLLTFYRAPDTPKEVGYAFGRDFWGMGIATAALADLITIEQARPLVASCAADNLGSIRVLEKAGFVKTHQGNSHGNARSADVPTDYFRLA